MLFTYPALDDAEKRVERATTQIRAALRRYVTAEPPGWTDLLTRMTRARALAASNNAAGVHVSEEDAIAAIDREDPANTDDDTWQAVVGYRQAATTFSSFAEVRLLRSARTGFWPSIS